MILLSACASKPLVLDANKTVQWTDALEKTHPHPVPYMAEFNKDGYSMYYLAAHHENDIYTPTFKLVRQAFEDYSVKAVLIEGVFASMGESPFVVLKTANESWTERFVGDGERGYAAVLATTREIPFFGGEPEDIDVFKEMTQQQKFTAEDVIGFYVVRQYPQWLRNKKLEKKSLEDVASGYIDYVCKRFSISQCMDYKKFKAWYKEKNKKDFPKKFDSMEAAPLNDGTYFTQKVSHHVGRYRDKFIVKQIESLVNTYKKVLVIYGASHLPAQMPAFQHSFGNPQNKTVTIKDEF